VYEKVEFIEKIREKKLTAFFSLIMFSNMFAKTKEIIFLKQYIKL